MSIPSAKTIQAQLRVTTEAARAIRAVLEDANVDTSYFSSVYRREKPVVDALRKVDKIISGYGVELVEDVDRENVLIWYVNTGDVYSGTILWRNDLGSFQATTYGDALAAMERKGYRAY